MLIWGWNTKRIGKQSIVAKCLACDSENISLVGYVRYYHIFWIPTFPYKKPICIECSDCKAKFEREAYITSLPSQNIIFKTPWWSFSGAAILAVLIVLSYFNSLENHKKYLAFQKEPHAGTYVAFKIDDPDLAKTPYVFIKIEEVHNDKLLVRFSQKAYNKARYAIKGADRAKLVPQDLLHDSVSEMSKEQFASLAIESLIE